MSGTVSPLPDRLDRWTRDDFTAALDERRRRLDEIFADGAERVSAGEAGEAKRLNDEMERLTGEQLLPHPGHALPGARPGSRAPDGPMRRYGRFDGLGRSFVHGITNGGKTMAVFDGTSGGTGVPSFYDATFRDMPSRQLFIRSLIPTKAVTADKVDYIRQTVATHAAAAVAAGGLKPTSTYTVERVTASVTTIAHVTEALGRSLLMDVNQLTTFIDDQLCLGVLLEEERQVINGNGSGANLTGILSTSGIQTQAKGTDPVPDAIYKAMTKVRAQFHEPDAIVIHPNDWQDVRVLRTADGLYIFGDPAQRGGEQIWGLPVITSPVITEGTALVGAFGTGCMVYDREQARVSFVESGLGNTAGEEMFSRNQIRFRGESRIGFGVSFPVAFCTVTGV